MLPSANIFQHILNIASRFIPILAFKETKLRNYLSPFSLLEEFFQAKKAEYTG